MTKRLLFSGALVAGMTLGPAVQPAQAMSDNLTSSMVATCVGDGGSCSDIIFELSLAGPASEYYVHSLTLETIFGPWHFGDVEWVKDGNGSVVTWLGNGNGGTLLISSPALSTPTLTPIQIRVSMTDYGSADQLAGIRYTANGSTSGTSTTTGFYSSGGTVTPEPITMVLLGTGLAGIAGVGVRRRREDSPEVEGGEA